MIVSSDWLSPITDPPLIIGIHYVIIQVAPEKYWYTSAEYKETLTTFGWFYSIDGINYDKPCDPTHWTYI